MRIKFKKTAVEDMRATERYIREQLNNPSAAAKLTRRVYDAIMLLEDNPFMGTELCSRYAVDTDIRFLVVAKQIVFYRVVGNEYVEVTRCSAADRSLFSTAARMPLLRSDSTWSSWSALSGEMTSVRLPGSITAGSW